MMAKGIGKRIELTQYGVKIVPTGLLGSKEILEIPYEAIVSIRTRPPSLLSRGWIHFATAGSPVGVLSSPSLQASAVIYKKSQQADIDKLKEVVQDQINRSKHPQT